MLDKLLRLRRARGDARAVRSGPKAVGKRAGQRGVRRLISRLFR